VARSAEPEEGGIVPPSHAGLGYSTGLACLLFFKDAITEAVNDSVTTFTM
jgi:hypothetical protein